MGTTTKMKRSATTRRLLAGFAAALMLATFGESAQAQEILLTGPLAGAPAVRKLRLHREGRFELAPAVSFTLLDQFQREILPGARLNYNLTEWFAIGVYGAAAFGPLHRPTALTDEIQRVNQRRRDNYAAGNVADTNDDLDLLLTNVNIGGDFQDQLGQIDWIAAPQVTFTPFRGKLSLFKAIFVDTDLYAFLGGAFVGIKERAECQGTSSDPCSYPLGDNTSFERVSRMAIAPTFGLGLSFYANEWSAIGLEYRVLPYSWNAGGFDTAGGGQDDEFPDGKITDKDRMYQFKQMITVSYNIYFPFEHQISE